MSQSPSLSDCRIALCQCLVGKAKTKEDDPQIRPRTDVGVEPELTNKRAMRNRIIERKRFFRMRPG